jgi:hypothetical protein
MFVYTVTVCNIGWEGQVCRAILKRKVSKITTDYYHFNEGQRGAPHVIKVPHKDVYHTWEEAVAAYRAKAAEMISVLEQRIRELKEVPDVTVCISAIDVSTNTVDAIEPQARLPPGRK